MTDGRWQRVQELFEEALKRPQEERASFLAKTCGDDPELHVEVESLLEHDEQAGSDFMKPPEVDPDPPGYEPSRSTFYRYCCIRKLLKAQHLRDTDTALHVAHAEHVARHFGYKLVTRQGPASC